MQGQTQCAAAVNQQSTIDTMGRAVRQLAGIPKGSLPTGMMELAELLHLTKAKRRMLDACDGSSKRAQASSKTKEERHPFSKHPKGCALQCWERARQGLGVTGQSWGGSSRANEAQKSPSKVNGLPGGVPVGMVLQLTSK